MAFETLQSRPSEGAGGDGRGGRFPVDGRLPTPLYHQIYVILRDKILNGTYRTGARIPSEQDLTGAYGVSRITVKRAVDELAAEGLVVRHRGRGTIVSHAPAPAPPVTGSIQGLLENIVAMGLHTEVEVLEFEYTVPPERVRRALDVALGAEVQRSVRLRRLEGAPFSYLTTYVPAAIGRAFGRDDLATDPLMALLERCGVEVGSADQTITATLADATVAPLLGVGIGAPLLSLTRLVRGQDEAPVEYITALYRPDRYQYRMMLSRVQAGNRNTWSPAGSDAGPRKTSPQRRARNREKSK